MTVHSNMDATGKNAEQRFLELREYFMDCLAFSGKAAGSCTSGQSQAKCAS